MAIELKPLIKKDTSEILTELKTAKTIYQDQARLYHPLWYLCFLRAHSQHYAEWAPDIWHYRKAEAYVKGRLAPRPKVDKVAKAQEDIIGFLTDNFPTMRVKTGADNPTDEERLAAKKCDPFIQYEQSEKRLNEIENIDYEFVWLLNTGNIFTQGMLVDGDDPIPFVKEKVVERDNFIPVQRCNDCGEVSPFEATQCIHCGSQNMMMDNINEPLSDKEVERDAEGNPLFENKPGKKLAIRHITPFQFYPHYRAKNFRTCPDWFIVTVTNVDWIYATYNKEVPETSSIDEIYDYQKILNEMVPDIYGDSLYFSQRATTGEKGNAILFEYYRRPVKGIDDDGAYIVFSDNMDELLHKGKYPYLKSPDGIQHFGWRKTSRFWYGGMTELAFPINDEINSVKSQLAQIRKNFSTPHNYLYEDGGVTREDFYNGNPVIECTDKEHRPDTETPPSIGNEIPLTLQLLYSDFDEITGWRDALKGASPKNVRTSSGLQMMLEQASAPFKKKITSYINTKKMEWEYLLYLAQNLMDDKQVLEFSGGKVQSEVIRANSIQGYLKIELDVSEAMPKSAVVQQGKILQLMGQLGGFITSNPHTLNTFMEKMDLPTMEYNPMYVRQKERAEYENILLKRGQDIKIDPFDNHEIHLYQHEYAYFGDDLQDRPEIKQKIAEHMTLHQQMYQQKMMTNPVNKQGNTQPTAGQANPSPEQQPPPAE